MPVGMWEWGELHASPQLHSQATRDPDKGVFCWGWHLPNLQEGEKIGSHSKDTLLNDHLKVCL